MFILLCMDKFRYIGYSFIGFIFRYWRYLKYRYDRLRVETVFIDFFICIRGGVIYIYRLYLYLYKYLLGMDIYFYKNVY